MKFELTNIQRPNSGYTLYRIRSLMDFQLIDGTWIHNGDLGGWVENEYNLSQEGRCWVMDDATVSDTASIEDNAIIKDTANVASRATVRANAIVYKDATIAGDAVVEGNSRIYDTAFVNEYAVVSDNAQVCGKAWIRNYAKVYGNAYISENAHITDNANIYDNAIVKSSAHVLYANIYGNTICANNNTTDTYTIGDVYDGEPSLANEYKNSIMMWTIRLDKNDYHQDNFGFIYTNN